MLPTHLLIPQETVQIEVCATFAIDFIKDLLLTASDASESYYGWSRYVDSLQGPTATRIYLFQQGAKTYTSSITYATNLSTVKNSWNLLRSKNFIEFVGALSNQEVIAIGAAFHFEPPATKKWGEAERPGSLTAELVLG